jgi:hypothetical protein
MITSDWPAQFKRSVLKYLNSSFAISFFALCMAAVGCGIHLNGPPAGAFLGRAGVYDYSPSAIQVGTLQQFWWCGQGQNPNKPSQTSDTIQYASFDVSTHIMTGPYTVLGETPGSWDSVFTCNPKVIQGVFNNPLGDGQIYSYAMYYVGYGGVANSIGVAFSSDGIHWKKYSQPIISATTKTNYGVGQPAIYNSDHKAGIWMFYEDSNAPPLNQHVEAISTDGLHFTVVGKLTTNGLPPEASWGDMAYDSSTGYWYAVFNGPMRSAEFGQLGVTLYRIRSASLLTGTTYWQQLKTFDTNLSGNELTFLAGLLRDQYGNVNVGPYPAIQIFPSISNPPPIWNTSPAEVTNSAAPQYWDIGKVEWFPDSPLMALNRFANKMVHEVTTGWVDPNGGFTMDSTLAHLYEAPQQGANLAFYGCKDGSTDYFVSTDSECEGKHILGTDGYGYSQPVEGLTLVALYSCYTGHDHFVSQDPKCEGMGTSNLLGYAVP